MRASRGNQRPVGYQRWRNLLFLHWPMPLEALRPLVPRELEIDLFTGQAYVSLIPFLIDESRPIGVPRALATRLLETNLRTYVRAEDGEAGIYFFSLDASSLLAVAAARLLYGLPYFPAVMSMRSEDSRTVYASRRRGAHGARLDVTWSVGEPMGTAVAGTHDHFLIERYNLVGPRWSTCRRRCSAQRVFRRRPSCRSVTIHPRSMSTSSGLNGFAARRAQRDPEGDRLRAGRARAASGLAPRLTHSRARTAAQSSFMCIALMRVSPATTAESWGNHLGRDREHP